MESLEEIAKARKAATEDENALKAQPPAKEPEAEKLAKVKDYDTQTNDDHEGKKMQIELPTSLDGSILPPTPYPQLSYTNPNSPDNETGRGLENEDDEEIDIAHSLERPSSPTVTLRNRGAFVEKVGEDGVSKMHKFILYETWMYFYVVGADLLDRRFRILRIARSESPDLNVTEDSVIYTKKETNQILKDIEDGNKSSGGLKVKTSFWGLLGFIKFTGAYYMLLVTRRKPVAMVGGHYIYQIETTELVSLMPRSAVRSKVDKHPEEARFIGILHNLDLSRFFYFSYSYDVTRTLQHNIMREREALQEGHPEPVQHDRNDMFVWNHHLLEPAKEALTNTFDWCISIIHGYVDQAALSVYWGRVVHMTIIARRSRFFAGARFLKRGANDLGYVANDVETEQIVSEMLTTSFHAPGPTLYANPNWTSYVHHRGSIPLQWTQDNSGVSPKPDIHICPVDPFYSTVALHFDNLFFRYGAPVYVLNLIKAKERTPRESKLLKEYLTAINYLNQFLPDDKQISYHAFDMSRASKSHDQDVIGILEAIADDFVPKTGIFHNGNDSESLRLQNGVVRTNCIDCLDRTNAAQFVIGKKALAYQLHALGVIDEPFVDYDSDAVNLFTHMWHDHGDTIAVQYGGSHLVNTMSTYRKINQWTSHSRDMVASFKRFSNNIFWDAQRQEAYNLFLGNYVFVQGQPLLWELASDYWLHHSNPRSWLQNRRPNYRHWFTAEYLEQPGVPPSIWPQELSQKPLQYFDDYWIEYYRPLAITSFQKIFSFNMHSNIRYILMILTQEGKYDLSPFKVRTANEHEVNKQNKVLDERRKGVRIVAPSEAGTVDTTSSIDARISSPLDSVPSPKPAALGQWLDAQQQVHSQSLQRRYTGVIKDTSFERTLPASHLQIPPLPTSASLPPPTKAEMKLDAFSRLVEKSLNPVPQVEEYEDYFTHPLNLRLAVSSNDRAPTDHVAYLTKADLQVQPTPSAGAAFGAQYSEDVMAAIVERERERREANLEEFAAFLSVGDEGLTVLDADWDSKRYKRYRQWLRGKSLFKQQPVRGEEPV